MPRLTYKATFLCLFVLLVLWGCTPAQQTPAERRQADLDYWNTVLDKFPNVEADLYSSETSYDQDDMGTMSDSIDTGLQEAGNAHNVGAQAPWNDVEQHLTAAADAMSSTLTDFKTGAQNNDVAAMTRAYDSYLAYERNALAAQKEARTYLLHDGVKSEQIFGFFEMGSDGSSNASALQHYIQQVKKKAST